MKRVIESKCYIGDILYFIGVDRHFPSNKIIGINLYKQSEIIQIVINKDEGISYWSDCYEMIAREENIDSYKPCNWTSPDIFVFSSLEKAEKFIDDLNNVDFVNSIKWW